MLIEHLQHILRVVDGFPAGMPGKQLRRGVCEAVEANTASARRMRLARLLEEIAGVRVPQESADGDQGGLATHLAALRAAVLPLVQDPGPQ